MKVQSKEHVLNLLSEHHSELLHLGVKSCGVFGSFVRSEPRDESDVDILVEFEEGRKTFDGFMHLAFFLEDLFGRKVDLVTTDSLSPYIGPFILREVEYATLSA